MRGDAFLSLRRRLGRDLLVAAGVCAADAAISTAGFTDIGADHPVAVVVAALVAVTVVAACWQSPVAAVGVALAHFTVVAVLLVDYRPMLPTLVCLYAVSAERRRRVSLPAAVVTFLLTAGVVVVDELAKPLGPSETALGVAVGLIGAIALFDVLAWGVGQWVRASRRHAATQARLAELQRREAVADERAAIARNMHDTVSGAVTGVLLHAAGARQILAAADSTSGHGSTVVALENIEAAAQRAMAELREMLGVLSSPVASRRLFRPEDVVDALRGTGLRVEMRPAGKPRPLPAAVADAARHVLQEALTNCARHAGAGARVTVLVGYRPSGVMLGIRDDGRGTPQVCHDGLSGRAGLAGTRIRVESVGGTLLTRPAAGGGFVVQAALPAPAGPA